jgi:hypothetical protein
MKFQVPQFVEVEDKLFWKLTLKQFIYIAGGGGMSLILFLWLPFFISIFLIMPIIGFSLALAFYKYNGRPFIVVVESATKYLFNNKLYIWRKVEEQFKQNTPAQKTEDDTSSVFVPKLSDSKLKEMSWALGTKESLNPVTQENKNN